MRRWRAAAGVLAIVASASVFAQGFGDLQAGAPRSARQRSYLTYIAEPAVVAANRPAVVEVHLQVADGLHVNSHTPKSDLLTPTAATLTGDEGVQVGPVEYPAGVSYRFSADPSESLEVYTGAITLRVPVKAPAGEHMLKGSVRYQACDQRSCFPPKMLALDVPFTAK